MFAPQLNTVCAALQNIDKVSLHTGDPGNTGANDSGETKQTITWSTPSNGMMKGSVTFSNVTGTFTHIGLWAPGEDDPEVDEFIHSRSLNVTLPTEQELIVLVEFGVEVKS